MTPDEIPRTAKERIDELVKDKPREFWTRVPEIAWAIWRQRDYEGYKELLKRRDEYFSSLETYNGEDMIG